MITESFIGLKRTLIRVSSVPVRIELEVRGKQSMVSFNRGAVSNAVIGDTLVVTCSRDYANTTVKSTGPAAVISDLGEASVRPDDYVYHPAKTMRLVAPPKWRLGVGVPVVTITVPMDAKYALVDI